MKRSVLRAMLFCFVVMFITLPLWAADDATPNLPRRPRTRWPT